jgi:two-component system, OmpR family, sensor kinase
LEVAERVDSALLNVPAPTHADLLERIQTLEHALQTRDDLLAVAAHELRNPMHSLLLQVTAALQLARKHEDRDMAQRLERVKNVIDRYVKRATVLLDACRYQAHRFQIHAEDFDLGKLLHEIVESFEAEAAFNRVELRMSSVGSVKGRWDRLALEQIVSNLVSNAIKYGAGAPVDIHLELDGPARVKLTVSDHGIGIAPEDHARIFEQFERAVGVDERRSGFGIGLWLVHNLVTAHGGRVEVHSTLNNGATFIVVFPLQN